MLGKECEQVEKARAKVIAERARIMQSRGLSSTAPPSQAQPASTAAAAYSKAPSQMQSTSSSSAAAYTKVSTNTPSTVAQSRSAVFTFGPAESSAAVTAPKSIGGPTSGSSMPIATTTQQQSSSSEGLPRTMVGANMAPAGSKQGSYGH